MKKNNSIFPYRALFGVKQLDAIKNVFYRSWKIKEDFGYNGYFERIYTKKFFCIFSFTYLSPTFARINLIFSNLNNFSKP